MYLVQMVHQYCDYASIDQVVVHLALSNNYDKALSNVATRLRHGTHSS